MTEEKRKAIRVHKPLAVQFGLKTDADIHWDMSLIKDISESGICIHTGIQLNKDDTCYLRFKTPTDPWNSLEITAHVLDSAPGGKSVFNTRLEFYELDDEQLRRLREYVAWVLASESNERSGK